MIRALVFLVFALAVAVGAVWLSDTPGRVSIVWLGYRIDTSAAVLTGAVVVVVVVGALVYRLLRFLRRAPGEFWLSRQVARRARGYRALTQGMVAVAAGDPDEAQRQARRADALLNEPPLTLLLSAQAAQLNGDEQAAKRFFSQMLERPETAFLGVRGLLRQALDRGDKGEALQLTQRANQIRPEAPWVQTTLLELQAAAGQWEPALETLRRTAKLKLIDTATVARRRAAILVERARLAEAAGSPDEALALASEAHKAAPEFVPATAAAINRLGAVGKTRRAVNLAIDAWSRAPHPDIAHAFIAIFAKEDPLQRLRQVERLAAAKPDHPESRLALAEAALAAQLWGEARRHLDSLLGTPEPPARACRLMAEIVKSEHGDLVAAESWRARADQAAPDACWVCDKCGAQAQRWSANCGHCGAFDSLSHRAPTRIAVLPPMGGAIATAAPRTTEGAPEAELAIPAIEAKPATAAAASGNGAEPRRAGAT
ncbi:MAG: heme biosynthesis protein HemY [Alphaproteobacteria bacterium]|nr:heme biosynthesis protein HemY [Alphaproteobacteria bacterium]